MKRMLANPNSWVEGQLPLRSSMTPRNEPPEVVVSNV